MTAIATTVAAVTALYFTAQSLRATTEQGQVAQELAATERLAKAAEQLSSDKIDARLAGIYLLQRLGKDSAPDREPITNLLAAFIRGHSPVSACGKAVHAESLRAGADIEAALAVLAKMPRDHGGDRLDLSSTCLAGVTVKDGDLSNMYLSRSNLSVAQFTRVRFDNVGFDQVDAYGAGFDSLQVRGGNFIDADLSRAAFTNVDVTGTKFFGAILVQTWLQTTTGLSHSSFEWGPAVSASADVWPVCDATTVWPQGFSPPGCRVPK